MGIDLNGYMIRNRPYLTSDQVKGLIKSGFAIGAYSIDHPLYSSVSLEDQLHQTIRRVKIIKRRFNLDYGVFSFPRTDNGVPRKVFNEIYKTGLVDATFGTGGMINDGIPNNFQRFSLEKPLILAEKIIALNMAKKFYNRVKGNDRILRTEFHYLCPITQEK